MVERLHRPHHSLYSIISLNFGSNLKILCVKTESFYAVILGTSKIALDTKLVKAYRLNSYTERAFFNSVWILEIWTWD